MSRPQLIAVLLLAAALGVLFARGSTAFGRPLSAFELDRLLGELNIAIVKTRNALARLDQVVARTRG